MRAFRRGWPALLASAVARLVLGALAVLVAASVLPAVLGWQTTVVMSGSMSPTLTPGDVVVVRPVDAAALHPGQIVLVDDPDVPGTLRIHRVAAVDGGRLRLKGDANPTADGSEVSTAAVHGVGTLRLPDLGLPALWSAEGRTAPLAATAAALAGLVALSLLHRAPESQRRERRRPAGRLVAMGAVGVVLAGLPGATGATGARAAFTATTATPSNTLSAAPYWSCGAAVTGASATQYYPLQEAAGTTAANNGSLGAAAVGTYSSSGVTYGARGPRCAAGQQSAITLNGSTGQMWSSNAVTNPQTFTEQIWFATTTTAGGKLMGFGDATGGGQSGNYDRHIYLLTTGQLAFGVYDGATRVVTSARAYNDGAWHLATATFSGTAGMTLYVDGVQVGRDAAATVAQNFTGYWRIGYDNLTNWPSPPTSSWFAGSLAHAAVFPTALTATEVGQQYGAAPRTCAQAAGATPAAVYLPLQESTGPTAANAGTAGSAGNGTYATSGVTYGAIGPNCGTNASNAVRLDGSTGAIWTTQAVANPQTFTEQVWFATTTTAGGKLIGFGDGTGGALSPDYDRHIYMTNSGALTFGIWNNASYTVTTPGAYNDGSWHLATATFSPTTGLAFYVDGSLIGTNTQTTAAWNGTGYWRIGADSVNSWPNQPSSPYFAGRLAHAGVTYRVLTAEEVTGQYLAGK